MPNRYIRASAIESEAVNALSFGAEVFYRRLLNRVDDFGRYTANLALLRAALFPLKMDEVRESTLSKWLTECADCGLVFTYEAGGKRLLVVNKWEQGRAKSSEYPPPPADICEQMQTYVYTREHMSAYAPDSDSDSDSGADTDADAGGSTRKARSAPQSDEEWLTDLAQDPAYRGIDVPTEHAKAKRWCETKSKRFTRLRFINWLNRCERPLELLGGSPAPQRQVKPIPAA